ncbi:unnamed protein product [Ranitomeya imitator]|uniref:Uncharacterized protein n=1 Tax=Ranitomeya imitator TaxID=111125 RepID=A0ABN9LML8_9NEOB|nr:unnamed protein product [Ranitomeya imitator]
MVFHLAPRENKLPTPDLETWSEKPTDMELKFEEIFKLWRTEAMEQNCLRVISDDDIKQFRQRLLQYDMSTLRILYEHFRSDLEYIVEILETRNLLNELSSRNVPMKMDYLLLEKELGSSAFSGMLICDIFDMGRDAVLALWESLFVLQNNCQHPNLIGVMTEITERGDTLVPQIILDENGHQLYQLSGYRRKEVQARFRNVLFCSLGTCQVPTPDRDPPVSSPRNTPCHGMLPESNPVSF